MRSDSPRPNPVPRRLLAAAAILGASCGPQVASLDDTTSGTDGSVSTFTSLDATTSQPESTSTGADESSSTTSTATSNVDEYDGCTSACTLSERSISAGVQYTCSTNDGALRCWGSGGLGVLGVPFVDFIGDDEPASEGDVDAGGLVVQIATGSGLTCALLVGGDVRCWGELANPYDELIGDDEPASAAPLVDLGGRAVSIAVADNACAILEGGAVRCWGYNSQGECGYGHTDVIGGPLGQSPAEQGDVDIGGQAVALRMGGNTTCVVLASGDVRCWGGADSTLLDTIGGGPIGDDELPSSAPLVDVGGPATIVTPSHIASCALLQDGVVRCIDGGSSGGAHGANGLGGAEDGPTLAETGPVELDTGGAIAVAISSGSYNATALLDDGTVRAWGSGSFGEAGYGPLYPEAVGDTETPASVGSVPIGGAAVAISTGYDHSCVILDTLAIRCWGASGWLLGFGSDVSSGWELTPAEAGDVPVW